MVVVGWIETEEEKTQSTLGVFFNRQSAIGLVIFLNQIKNDSFRQQSHFPAEGLRPLTEACRSFLMHRRLLGADHGADGGTDKGFCIQIE